MSESNPIRIFVSHAFSETDDYLRVFEFLESVDRFYYLNVSKPENRPQQMEALRDELIAQIKASEVVLVVSDVWQQNEKLVNYMLDIAAANDISALAIQPYGGLGETPDALGSRVRDVLAWNERNIADSITFVARGKDTQRWEVIDFPGYSADGPIEDN